MRPLDPVLAVAGLAATRLERGRGSHRLFMAVVIALLAISAVPTFLIGSSQRPTDLTFEDVRLNRIPAMTTWVRVTGDLRFVEKGAIYFYRLHDPDNDAHYIVVTAREPLETGHVFVTGRVSAGSPSSNNVGTIDDADVPPVPKRNEPFALILLPAFLGIALIIGRRLGYPVVRGEGRPKDHPGRLAPDERLSATWSGRIGSETVVRDAPRTCTVGVRIDPELAHLSVVDDRGERTVPVRRSTPSIRPIRTCHVRRTEPGIEIHSQSSDLVLVLDDRRARDRLLVSLA